MKTISIAFLLVGLAFSGFSQSPSKVEKIKTLLDLTGSGNLGVQVIQNMMGSFKKSLPNVPEEYWDNFMKEVNPEALSNLIIPIYDKYYTDDDINKMIEFYQSPLGKKIISTTPQIMQESMSAGQAWGKEIGAKVYNDLKAKGFIKDGQ